MDLQALILESQPGRKIRHLKHKLTYKNTSNLMADAVTRFRECRNKKPVSQIRHEINACKKYWGCYPLHYYRYNLYREDRNLTESEIVNYIPEFFFYSFFLPYHDSNKYEILLEEKNITEQLFRSLDIKQPKTAMKLIHNSIYSSDLKGISLGEIKRNLLASNCEKIFLKPVDGKGGYGIRVFHRDPAGDYISKDQVRFDEPFLKSLNKDFIVQEGIIQNRDLNRIYPHSVNTFRIATENMQGEARIVCAVMRIGRGENEVDNASQGGMLLKIDVETGETGKFAITELGQIYDKHPDTGFQFNGFKVGNWEQIKKFTLASAMKLPNFTYLGWDIANSVEGPAAIEVNLGFGLDLFQVALGGLREAFHIDHPRQYYKAKRLRA